MLIAMRHAQPGSAMRPAPQSPSRRCVRLQLARSLAHHRQGITSRDTSNATNAEHYAAISSSSRPHHERGPRHRPRAAATVDAAAAAEGAPLDATDRVGWMLQPELLPARFVGPVECVMIEGRPRGVHTV